MSYIVYITTTLNINVAILNEICDINLVPRLFPLCEDAEEKPWFRLVTCLPDFGRLQKSLGRGGRNSKSKMLHVMLMSLGAQ